MLLVFIAWRLTYIAADTSGTYQNTDEGFNSYDTRKLVLYGTIFHDGFNFSVLMPMFTLYEYPFVKLFGIGFFEFLRIRQHPGGDGVRVVDVPNAEKAGRVAGGTVAGVLVRHLVFHVRQFADGRARPCADVVFDADGVRAYRSLETNHTWQYIAVFLLALACPLVNTSGVFIYSMVGGVLLYKALTDRPGVNWKGVFIGLATSLVVLLLIYLFWFRPHWIYLMAVYNNEVAQRHAESLAASAQRLLFTTLDISPLIAALFVVALTRLGEEFLDRPKEPRNLEVIMLCWMAGVCAVLIRSDRWFPRWNLWFIIPFCVLALREFARITLRQKKAVQWCLVGAFVVGVAVSNWNLYREYYETMTFHIQYMTLVVEKMAGTNVISGSGLEELVYSPTLNIVSRSEIDDRNCDNVTLAYPRPEMTPTFLGFHMGNDQSKFEQKLQAWYAACPEWKHQYQPYALNQRIDYGGACDLWMIRTNVTLDGKLIVYRPPIIR